MTRRSFLFVVMLGALSAFMTGLVMAQNREATAEIPFSFTVCSQQLPAGKYRVQPITSATTNLLLVRSEDNRSAEIACTHDIRGNKPVSTGKLVFNRYGNQYFLAELWFPGEITGHEIYKSDTEEAVIKELAPNLKRGKVTIRVTETKPD